MTSVSTPRTPTPSPVGNGLGDSIKFASPEHFKGERGTLKRWIIQIQLYVRMHSSKFSDEAAKVMFASSYLSGAALDWVMPRLEDYISNPGGRQEEETRQMFHQLENFFVCIKTAFGEVDEDRAIERRLQNLRQRTSAAVYAAAFRTLAYKIDWDDSSLTAHFYQGLHDRVKDAMVAVERPDSLEAMIETAVRIDDRQQERYFDKQVRSKRPNRGKQSIGDPMEIDVSEKGTRTKTCYTCGKLGHVKRNCPKEAAEVSEQWIEVTEDEMPATGSDHNRLSWTACWEDSCKVHQSDKVGSGYWPREPRPVTRTIKRPRIQCLPLFAEKPITAAMEVKIGEKWTTALINDEEKNKVTTRFLSKINGYVQTNCTVNNDGEVAGLDVETKHGLVGTTSFQVINSTREYAVLGKNWRRDTGGGESAPNKKSQLEPQTIHFIAYKNLLGQSKPEYKHNWDEVQELDLAFKKGNNPTETKLWKQFEEIQVSMARAHGKKPSAITGEWKKHALKASKGNFEVSDEEIDSEQDISTPVTVKKRQPSPWPQEPPEDEYGIPTPSSSSWDEMVEEDISETEGRKSPANGSNKLATDISKIRQLGKAVPHMEKEIEEAAVWLEQHWPPDSQKDAPRFKERADSIIRNLEERAKHIKGDQAETWSPWDYSHSDFDETATGDYPEQNL